MGTMCLKIRRSRNSRGDHATTSDLMGLKKIAAKYKATVIIQHDARDVGKLPAFPAAAQ